MRSAVSAGATLRQRGPPGQRTEVSGVARRVNCLRRDRRFSKPLSTPLSFAHPKPGHMSVGLGHSQSIILSGVLAVGLWRAR